MPVSPGCHAVAYLLTRVGVGDTPTRFTPLPFPSPLNGFHNGKLLGVTVALYESFPDSKISHRFLVQIQIKKPYATAWALKSSGLDFFICSNFFCKFSRTTFSADLGTRKLTITEFCQLGYFLFFVSVAIRIRIYSIFVYKSTSKLQFGEKRLLYG